MTLPTVHLNGTSARDLLTQYQRALKSVQAAVDDIAETYPNGRDYYPQGDGVVYVAMQEHRERVDALMLVRDELARIVRHIEGEEE